MKIKKAIETTNDIRAFEFLNKALPSMIFNNDDITSNGINVKDILEDNIRKCWEDFCNKHNYPNEIKEDFNFIYTVRLRLNRQKNLNSGIFFIHIPTMDKVQEEDNQISGGILISENGEIRFFCLKELSDRLVPIRFIKNNQNYLLYELDKDFKFTNWGSLINPKNFSDLSETIFCISGV